MSSHALMLVGSPRGSRSTSNNLGGYLLQGLSSSGWQCDTIFLGDTLKSPEAQVKMLSATDKTDLVILAFPLYVDHLPAIAMEALELIADHRSVNKPSYPQGFLALVNCGFPESEQNNIAVAVAREFATQNGFEWRGGLAMGMGGVISGRPLSEMRGPATPIKKALDLAVIALSAKQPVGEDAMQIMAKRVIPRWLYVWIGNRSWKQMARKNGTTERLYSKPYSNDSLVE